jgi:hypothetical protein
MSLFSKTFGPKYVHVVLIFFFTLTASAQVPMRSTSVAPGKHYTHISPAALAQNIDTLFTRNPGSSSSTFPSILLTPQASSPGTPEGTLYYNNVTHSLMLKVSGSWVQVLTTADGSSAPDFNITAAQGIAVTPYLQNDLLNLDAGLTLSMNPRATLDADTDLMTITESGYYQIEGTSGFHTHHGGHDLFTLSVVLNGVIDQTSSQTASHNHIPGYTRTTLTTYLTAGTTVGLSIETIDTGGSQLASSLTIRKIG